eukprot:gnl/TRDRNA2_/TRDRNA2_154547_c0_seq2.p1 gnl/TRDRNA2_/TRDRNA2_154547_c0~~gnl/TRDRNA2_/TRDRNA2_154547_c0_seq2.p1  ORF type:complete len:544 (+),score=90.84 gnl/TRDRNA2_/TRDRNA2_154547_c0_seq2:125-1756(+)
MESTCKRFSARTSKNASPLLADAHMGEGEDKLSHMHGKSAFVMTAAASVLVLLGCLMCFLCVSPLAMSHQPRSPLVSDWESLLMHTYSGPRRLSQCGASASASPGTARDIDLLLKQHGDRIQKLLSSLRSAGEDDVGAPPFDEIWALRFLLSNKGEDEVAFKNAKETLAWRREKKDLIDAAREGKKLERFAHIERMVAADYHGCTTSGQPIYFLRAGILNLNALMEEIDADTIVDFTMYKKEVGFVLADEITRRTRVLTKIITVNDLNHISISSLSWIIPDKRFQTMLSAVSRSSEVYYPQLLEKAVVINVPYIFYSLWSSVVKRLMSEKARAKVAICPDQTLTEGTSRPIVSDDGWELAVDMDAMPTFLGGRCRCKPGCISGIPNDQYQMIARLTEDGMWEQKVAALDKHDVFVEVDEGDRLAWTLILESHSIVFWATFSQPGSHQPLVMLEETKLASTSGEGRMDGELVAPCKGTFLFTFDNSFSYFTSKKIKYMTTLLPPENIQVDHPEGSPVAEEKPEEANHSIDAVAEALNQTHLSAA